MASLLSHLGSVGSRILAFVRRRRVLSAVIAALVIFGGVWLHGKIFPTATQTTYTLGTASTSTIVASISATGQIATADSVDIQAKVSGDITAVYVKEGQRVSAGTALFSIDSTDARAKVVQAESSLATSRLQYQRDAAAAPIDYEKAQDALAQDTQDLADTYVDTYNKLSSTYLNLPTVMTGTQNALYGYDMSLSRSQWNTDVLINVFQNQDARALVTGFADIAKDDYQAARSAYDAALSRYKTTSRASESAALEDLLDRSLAMSTLIAQSVQSELNFLNTVSDQAQKYNVQLPSYFSTLLSSERTYLSTANSEQASLLAQKKSIATAKQAVRDDQHAITLLQVGNATDGTNPISLQVSAQSIASAEQNLAQLRDALADYTVRAPFAGVLSTVSGTKGETASGSLATLVTSQQIAQLSVNEVDAAKIAAGQKATLTFDAIEGLTLTGRVLSVDSVGTVSQGVVSYTVKIGLDTQDSRVKPGMTVNAAIITDTRIGVLAVPTSAVKTTGGRTYVLVFDPAIETTGTTYSGAQAPREAAVTTGISDDTSVEITSGLTGGEQIVVRSSTAAQTTTSSTSRTQGGFGGPGLRL